MEADRPFGGQDGIPQFALPDLRSEVPFGHLEVGRCLSDGEALRIPGVHRDSIGEGSAGGQGRLPVAKQTCDGHVGRQLPGGLGVLRVDEEPAVPDLVEEVARTQAYREEAEPRPAIEALVHMQHRRLVLQIDRWIIETVGRGDRVGEAVMLVVVRIRPDGLRGQIDVAILRQTPDEVSA